MNSLRIYQKGKAWSEEARLHKLLRVKAKVLKGIVVLFCLLGTSSVRVYGGGVEIFSQHFLFEDGDPNDWKTTDVLEALVCRSACDGNIKELKKLAERDCLLQGISCSKERNPFVCAAAHGHVDVLKLLFKEVCSHSGTWFFDESLVNNCCLSASIHGQPQVLHFLFKEVFPPHFFPFFNRELFCHCCVAAASQGHHQVLKMWLKEFFPQGCLFFCDPLLLNSCCLCAAANGHLEVLHLLFKKIFPKSHWFIDHEIFSRCCICAADHGHAKVLDFLLKEASHLRLFTLDQQDLWARCFSHCE